MARAMRWAALAIGGLAAVGAVSLYHRITGLRAERVSGDVHVLFGTGGNVGVLSTAAGAVVVDTLTFRGLGERVRTTAESLAGAPVVAVINTHYHGDHTHGNPGFAPGTPVLATHRTRELLEERDADAWTGDRAQALPSVLFERRHVLAVGGKEVRILHPGRGHTSGDLVALFVEDRVLHVGDLFFHGRYPRIDLEGGGSLAAWIESLDRVLELEFDHVIPGHGPVADRAALVAFQDFLRELWQVASQAAADGRSLEDTLATARLTRDAGFGSMHIPFVVRIDRESVLGEAWREATRSAAGAP